MRSWQKVRPSGFHKRPIVVLFATHVAAICRRQREFKKVKAGGSPDGRAISRYPQYTRLPLKLPGLGGAVSNFPREVVETALAHVIGDKAEQAYRRSTMV